MNQHGERPKILIICDYYLPGFESGGALRTLSNMVERLADTFDFRIITRDHDGIKVRTPYPDVRINEWNRIGNTYVYYLSKDQIKSSRLRKLIKEIAPDAIYLNSFFSPLTISALTLLKLRRIPRTPVVLAPEGEFSPGALSLKFVRKQLYITYAKSLRLLHNIVWKAASESEKSEIETVLGKRLDIQIAPNMPPSTIFENYDQAEKPPKLEGHAQMIFLSRFMRKKNFNWLLEPFRSVKGELSIDIYGTLEETDYWNKCQNIVKTLPANIKITAKGPVSHEKVSETLAKYHFFILPTLGENFGHVFLEAMASGCPLIISNRTPWQNLEAHGVGWDLPLEDVTQWIDVLNKCLSMKNDEYRELSENSRSFAVAWLSDSGLEKSNTEILWAALDKKRLA